jgi:ABC-type transport system substrate-binding protein
VDAAENVALGTYDQAVRKKAYAVVQEGVATQVPVIVTSFARRIQVYNTDFKGYKPAHAVTTFWNTWEWSI